jgi:lipopolysaccharide export system permease protein
MIPRIFTRHVVGQFAAAFLATLSALTLAILLFFVVKEAVDTGLGPTEVSRLIPYVLPDSLQFSLPAACLFAVALVYGRMSGMNEVVALKALGVHPMSIVWPVLAAAFVLSLTAVWLGDVAVSWGRTGVQRVVLAAAEEIIYGMLRTHRSYADKSFSINVKEVDGKRLIRPTISIQGAQDGRTITLTAEEAEVRADKSGRSLVFVCKNSVIDFDGKVTAREPGVSIRTIPLPSAQESGTRPSLLPFSQIPRAARQQQELVRSIEEEFALDAGLQALMGDFEAMASSSWSVRVESLDTHRRTLHRLQAEPHRRWANGFSCLAFVMVGIPVAIRLKNSTFITSFFACFLPVLVAYYPLLAFGQDAAKDGRMPPIGAWTGNVLFTLVGAWLLRGVVRR